MYGTIEPKAQTKADQAAVHHRLAEAQLECGLAHNGPALMSKERAMELDKGICPKF